MTAAIVRPSASAMDRSISESSVAETLSRPDRGSSRKSTLGSATSSRPTFTRLRWPPEMPRSNSSPIFERWIAARLSESRTLKMSRCLRDGAQSAGSRVYALNSRLSKTVSSRCMTSSCGTKATRLRHLASESHSSPLTRMTPDVFLTLPVTRFMIVVLPAPDAPMIAVDVPGRKQPDGPRMIVTPLGRSRRMSSNSMR